MSTERLIDLYEELVRQAKTGDTAPPLCVVAAEFISVAGAGIAVLPSGGQMTALCASNNIAKELMNLEVTLGEGPGVDACSAMGIISESDLLEPTEQRWIMYSPLALTAGAKAVFGFPIRIGAIRLGALSLFEDHSGSLSEAQVTDAHLMASVVGRVVLSLQADAPPNGLAAELQREGTFEFSVHQAAGMVAVQGGVSVGEALARLRAHAFAIGSTAAVFANQVIHREVIFDALSHEWRNTGTSTR